MSDFLQRLEEINKIAKKASRHNSKLSDYTEALNQYRYYLESNHIETSNLICFYHANRFFCISDNTIIFMNAFLMKTFSIDNQEDFFKFFSLNYNKELETKLMKALVAYIKFYKLPTYEETLIRFRNSHNGKVFPIVTDEYIVIDGNLVRQNKAKLKLVIMKDVYSFFKGENITKTEIKPIFRALRRRINHNNLELEQFQHKQELERKSKLVHVDREEIRNSILRGEFHNRNKSNINIQRNSIIKENKFYIYYKTPNLYKMYFSRETSQILVEQHEKIPVLFKSISISLPYLADIRSYFPTDLSERLYLLTGGSIHCLNEICELIASIQCNENILQRFHILWGNDGVCSLFLGILFDLYYENYFDCNFKALCKISSTNELIDKKLKNKFLAIINNKGTLPRNEALIRLRKYIKSQKVSVKEELMGKTYYKSNLVFIYSYSTGTELRQLKESLGTLAKVHDFSRVKISSNYETSLPEKDVIWAKTILAAYGLKRLAMQKFSIKKASRNIPSNSRKFISVDLVSDFIRDCCVIDKDSDVFAEDVHGYYKEYVKRFSSIEPLSRVMFVKRMKVLTNFDYKRPHHKFNGSNKYAFMGLRINLDVVNQQPVYEIGSEIDSKKEVFFKYIKSMSDDLDMSAFINDK